MKIKPGDWVWYRNQAHQVDAIGDGQVTISHIDTPGTNVRNGGSWSDENQAQAIRA